MLETGSRIYDRKTGLGGYVVHISANGNTYAMMDDGLNKIFWKPHSYTTKVLRVELNAIIP